MRIKKYTAATMKEALLQIKSELGDGAMILKTRRLPRKIFTLGEQQEVEVTAAIDDTIGQHTAARIPQKEFPTSDGGVYLNPKQTRKTVAMQQEQEKTGEEFLPPVKERTKSEANPAGITTSERLKFMEIKEELKEMKVLLASILATGESAAAGGFAGPWAILYKRLVDSEIEQAIAEDLINKLKSTTPEPDKSINKKFMAVLGECFPVAGPIMLKKSGPLFVALVGPTGVGKTTTIAKLATHYCLNKNNRVSIITADTYRIAAVEQMHAFTEIINLNLQVVFSPAEVPDAIKTCLNDDIVFIDTAGRSQRNMKHMKDLEDFLDALHPDEIHLVLSATTKDSDLADIIKRYKHLNVNRLLFTKLDETKHLGNIFNTVKKYTIPVSYFTIGQSVPDDIELAQSGRFVQRLLEGSSL